MSKLTLSFKGTDLRVFPVIKGSMTIGNDPSSTIHIDSLALQAEHARIDTQEDTSILVNIDEEHDTFVNNKPVQKHILQDGDLIRVGKHTLAFKFESASEHPEESTMTMEMPMAEQSTDSMQMDEPSGIFRAESKSHAWLQIMTGQNLGKTLSLNRPMTNLGKPGVATAVITRRNDGYFLSHLEGEQSPLIGDEAIDDRSVQLKDGDTITIGNIKMLFFLD